MITIDGRTSPTYISTTALAGGEGKKLDDVVAKLTAAGVRQDNYHANQVWVRVDNPAVLSILRRRKLADLQLFGAEAAALVLNQPRGAVQAALEGVQPSFIDGLKRPVAPLSDIDAALAHVSIKSPLVAAFDVVGSGAQHLRVSRSTVQTVAGAVLFAASAGAVLAGARAGAAHIGSELETTHEQRTRRVGMLGGTSVVAMAAGGLGFKAFRPELPTIAKGALGAATGGLVLGGMAALAAAAVHSSDGGS